MPGKSHALNAATDGPRRPSSHSPQPVSRCAGQATLLGGACLPHPPTTFKLSVHVFLRVFFLRVFAP